MKIEPPADDFGLQNLKRSNRTTAADVQQVDETQPRPRIAPSEQRREPLPVMPERRSGERRSGRDRRSDETPHLLDTRTPHERRTRIRRQADRDKQPADEENPPARPGGIDTLA